MTSLIPSSPPPGFKPKLWVPGDWNAFFGFGTNILVNLLTLSGLLRFVLQMPGDLVFKRILPAAGLMMCMSTMYYARLAYQLAKKTGRSDVCALPSGISVPAAIATSPAGIPPYFTPPNQLTRMIEKQTTPMTGVMYISSAGFIEMNVIDTPASVPSSAARGVILGIYGATKPPIIRIKLWKNTQTRPADQPFMGSPVFKVTGSMMTKVTMNMCGTLTPEGNAQTSLRPVRCASR